jgi:hypothetical protein
MYLSRLTPSPAVSVDPVVSVVSVDPVVAVVSASSVKKVSTSSVKKVSASIVKKVPESSVKKVSSPILPPKAKEPLSSESEVESESESDSDSSVSEVDMIVSKVSESLKQSVSLSPSSESESDPEDSDDCMLDADEIHDEDGKTYYIDESKSVIELDEDGYGVKICILKELKSGSIFYKNKRWKIDYFPKK